MRNLLELIEETIYALCMDKGIEAREIAEIELQGYAFCVRSWRLI